MSTIQSRFTFDTVYGRLNGMLLALFTFFAILMPADNLNIKIFIFSLLLVLNIKTIVFFLIDRKHLYYMFFTVIFPLLLFMISITRVPMGDVLAGVYIFSYIWLLPVILKYQIDYLKYILGALLIIALIICLSALLDKIGIMSISSNPLLVYLNTAQEAQISVSSNAIFTYVIFLNGSPLILILLLYSLFNNKIIWGIVAFMALLLSGTRANIYEALAIVAIYFIFFVKNRVLKTIFIISIIYISYRYSGVFLARVELMNDAKLSGDAIRDSNYHSIIQSMNQNPMSYFLGNGIGSQYFSPARLGLISTSELSYFEFLRQNGLIGLSIFLVFILRPIIPIFKDRKTRWICLAYIGYLILAYTDPFLFTATGFVIYLLVYFLYERSKDETGDRGLSD